MKWEIGLSTGIAYAHPIEDVLPFIGESGFRAVEVATARDHIHFDEVRALEAVKRQLFASRLRVHSLHAPFGHDLNLTSPDAEQRRCTLERLTTAAGMGLDTSHTALGGQLFEAIERFGALPARAGQRQPRAHGRPPGAR